MDVYEIEIRQLALQAARMHALKAERHGDVARCADMRGLIARMELEIKLMVIPDKKLKEILDGIVSRLSRE